MDVVGMHDQDIKICSMNIIELRSSVDINGRIQGRSARVCVNVQRFHAQQETLDI